MKTRFKNRNGLKITVRVDGDLSSDKLVFITHGLSGSKDQPHIEGMRNAFKDAGYSVVSFDTTNSFGESEGDSINATVSSYISDLEDVVAWSEKQTWYKEPFVLAGHSLGGISSLVFTSRYPDKVKALFPMSTVVSGKLWLETWDKEELKIWKNEGYFLKESKSMPGKRGRIGYGLAEDMLNYDALEIASGIKCAVLLVVGADDSGTTPKMHQLLFEKLGGKKELHIIKGMEHTPKNDEEINEMKKLVKQWLAKI